MTTDRVLAHLDDWKHREALAQAALPLIGALYREQAVVATALGVSLVRKSAIEVITILEGTGHAARQKIAIEDVVTLLQLMCELSLGRVRVDVGKLLLRFAANDAKDLRAWARSALKPLLDRPQALPAGPRDVVLYGFGRIGRLIARILINKTGGGDKFRLRAIVLRKPKQADLAKRASLLRRDSVHGVFAGSIELDKENNAIIANGNMISVLYANAPEEVDYAAHGINDAIVIDNTGMWRSREALGRHLSSPHVSKVILTAPGKGIPNIVYGVNSELIEDDETLFSAASCTTNAIAPVLKVIDDKWGVRHGHLETIHAYTNDQNLIDNYHPKPRRGRGAPLNMVITTTGAAKAVSLALPNLEGKLTGSAIRVPTPNVSLAILNLQLDAEVTREALNDHLREAATDSPLHGQIGFTRSKEVVSSDLVGDHHAGIVDSVATLASGTTAVLYVWYDNEYGYSCQVVRLLQQIAGVKAQAFPAYD